MKTTEQRQLHHSGVFIDNFGHISHLFLLLLLLTLSKEMLLFKNFLNNKVNPLYYLEYFHENNFIKAWYSLRF